MNSFREIKFLLGSILLHSVIVCVWILYQFRPAPKPAQEPPLVISFQEKSPMSKTPKSAGVAVVKRGSAQGPGSLSLKGYLPEYRFEPSARGVSPFSDGKDTYSTNPLRDDPRSEWGAGSSSFERIQDYNLYRVLFAQVDGSLSYPGVLARHQIKGVVNARIVFNEQGACDWPLTKIQGHDPYLSLYILNVLKNVCQMNYKPYLKNRQISNADMSFQFDINENNDPERIAKQNVIIGNTLLFYRNSHQSVTEWEIGPFRGQFPVPVIYMNLPWIQEHWDSLMHNKDPLREFKKEFGAG
jgi:hypothetical protein